MGAAKRVLIATAVFAVAYVGCQRYLSFHVGLGIMLAGEYFGIVQRATPGGSAGETTIGFSPNRTFAPPPWFMQVWWPLQFTILALPPFGVSLLVYHKLTFRRLLCTHAHCNKCGYDLTGNTSGTCPECGAGL
jgi:hypothetical protein